ncbi:winged helix-turn-helix domain-containing protein [Paenibacillus larvae]|nr:winged helix-turn-helix domain-containing protein [Paenibacillus larvae]MDT2254724.1 winged helix-turn-helix domain-containing protein [Paenibacillus larvae]
MSSYIHTYENGGRGSLANQAFLRCSYSVDKAATDALETNRRHIRFPMRSGFTAKHNWTLELIATYVEREWGHCYSLEAFPRVMGSWGIRKEPTYTLAADPKKQRHFTETTFPELKKSY